jgi:hypothetical protein
VERRVGEHGVERVHERQRLARHDARVEAAGTGRLDHARARIDADHQGTPGPDLLRQHAVAAPQVEHALAGLRIEELQHRSTQRRHEPRVPRVALRIPALLRAAHRPFLRTRLSPTGA